MLALMEFAASLGGMLIDRLFPDPEQRAKAQLELLRLTHEQQNREAADALARDLAQARINEADANSGDAYRGGWRPGAGWVCVLGLGYEALMRPLLPWFLRAMGTDVPDMPSIDTETLMGLLMGLLGLGGLRTFERVKGKA